MRGFIFGSLGLVALYVAVTSSENAAALLGGSSNLITKLLSSEVAGVKDRAGAKAGATVTQDDGSPSSGAPASFGPSRPTAMPGRTLSA